MYRFQPKKHHSRADGKTVQVYILWHRSRFLRLEYILYILIKQRGEKSFLPASRIYCPGQMAGAGRCFWSLPVLNERM